MNDPLQLPLRDIHLPPEPGFWPPAPGWWLLAALVLGGCACVYMWLLYRRRARRSALGVARNELDNLRRRAEAGDLEQTIRDLSVLLRRVAISLFPRKETAGLTGTDWLRFLDRPFPERPFSEGAGKILIDAPYRRRVDVAEIAPLFALCESWFSAAGEVERNHD